jgi:S-adenosylmethionine:tRNA ribosyltransferase-isomerase
MIFSQANWWTNRSILFTSHKSFNSDRNGISATSPVIWKSYVGNAKRWKSGVLQMDFDLENQHKGILRVKQIGRNEDTFSLEFSWQPEELTFFSSFRSSRKNSTSPIYSSRSSANG